MGEGGGGEGGRAEGGAGAYPWREGGGDNNKSGLLTQISSTMQGSVVCAKPMSKRKLTDPHQSLAMKTNPS